MTARRKPYRITVRRMANGADYTAILYLTDSGQAFDRMARKACFMELYEHGVLLKPTAFRLIECERVEQ